MFKLQCPPGGPQPPPHQNHNGPGHIADRHVLHDPLYFVVAFPSGPQVGGQTFASKFAFFLAAGFGMEFLCEDCCLYRVKFPVSGCLWLPVNPKSCVPLHCLCKAKKLGKRPWQLPSPFRADSFGSKFVHQFTFLTCTLLLLLRYAICMFDAIAI